jgi:hypothetical protein
MRSLAALLITLSTPAAFADTIAAPAETEPLRGNVLVWHDATFYTAPVDSASTLHVATLAARTAGRVVPMHVVATRGAAFVEVEFADDAGCTWTRLSTSDDIAKLHLFVKRSDLAPVLVKPFEKAFADGTRIALKPGVPVVATGATYQFSLLGHELDADIPAASVGHSYPPTAARNPSVSDQEYVIAAGTKALLGDKPASLDGVHAYALAKRGDTALVTFEDRCTSVTVAAPAAAVRATEADRPDIDTLTGYGTLGMRDGDYFPKLTPLSSSTGRQIAYAAKPIYLMGVSMTKTTCINRRVRLEAASEGAPHIDPADDDDLRLCAPTAKVAHEKLRSARSANGTTSR